jgi:hypothetical protein
MKRFLKKSEFILILFSRPVKAEERGCGIAKKWRFRALSAFCSIDKKAFR